MRLGSPELSVPPGLVDDHDAAGRVRHVSRDGVDGKSAVVEACLLLSGRHQQRVERTQKDGDRRNDGTESCYCTHGAMAAKKDACTTKYMHDHSVCSTLSSGRIFKLYSISAFF